MIGIADTPGNAMDPWVSAAMVARAPGEGGRVATGGSIPDLPGSFYRPTLIADVDERSEVYRNEIFGPVLTVRAFTDDDDGIRQANDTEYGLAASAWTRDVYRAQRASREIKAGCVWINDHIPIISEMPHGGVGASGFGKDMSDYSFEEYLTIKHVMSGVNPQGCRVTAFKRPSDTELRHDFLWRATTALPERGCIGVFNRSYYEDVLVVRVHPELLGAQALDPKLWRRRFQDIAAFERHLARSGTTIVKFFLHISKAEQGRRFLERLDDPAKQWKFLPADLAERAHFEAYQDAYEEALTATSTKHAPWYVIPADDKHAMRALVAAVLVHTVEGLDLRPPVPDETTRAELAAARTALLAESSADGQPGAMSTNRE